MYRLTILYGHTDDPAEFDRYYYDVHMPIARKMKGLKRWTIGKLAGTTDGGPAPYYMIVTMETDTREDMAAFLASPEAQAASADVPNFAHGGALYLYDEVETIV